jgi:hypothetical protein
VECAHRRVDSDIDTEETEWLVGDFVFRTFFVHFVCFFTEWQPQWTDDGSICARISGSEVQFCTEHIKRMFLLHSSVDDIELTARSKFVVKGVASIALSPGKAPYHIAAYVPALKVSTHVRTQIPACCIGRTSGCAFASARRRHVSGGW